MFVKRKRSALQAGKQLTLGFFSHWVGDVDGDWVGDDEGFEK